MTEKSGAELILPDESNSDSKKVQVEQMFDRIAKKYDFLNHSLSMGIDRRWRKKAINAIAPIQPKKILDVATGTGDLAIQAARQLSPTEIIGVDISEGMMQEGRKKIEKEQLSDLITLQRGDSEQLPFCTGYFDAALCAFGVRNFENLKKGIGDMSRVIRPNGKIAIIELSQPTFFPIKQIYQLYFGHLLPLLGRLVSKDKRAYSYLPESVAAFPKKEAFCQILKEAGFQEVKAHPLTLGIATLFIGTKQSL